MAVGFGQYYIALYAVILSLFAFTLVWFIEKHIVKIGDETKNHLFGNNKE